MIELEVKLEQRDIDAGWPGSSKRCPVGLAIARIAGVHGVIVLEHYCTFRYRDVGYWADLPEDVKLFNVAFDAGGDAGRGKHKPFGFVMKLNAI